MGTRVKKTRVQQQRAEMAQRLTLDRLRAIVQRTDIRTIPKPVRVRHEFFWHWRILLRPYGRLPLALAPIICWDGASSSRTPYPWPYAVDGDINLIYFDIVSRNHG